jgi:putative peptide zinc metalloprotease protein
MTTLETNEILAARLRSDLVQSYQQTGDSACLVIKDPHRGRFFRFGEIEAFIIGRLSGECTVQQVQTAVEEQFSAPLSAEMLQQFVGRLGRLGLLHDSKNEAPKPPMRQRVRGNLLYLRFPGLDPDRLLAWLHARLWFLFTRASVTLSLALIACGFGFWIMHWDEIARDIPRLYNVQSLLVMWATTLTVVTMHEFAHGLTCKNFGGTVREMGFMLLYFQPAFYCNVSDAWLFPKKSHRLWVSFAGAYFELTLWSIATFLWWITDPETVINYLALVVMSSSAIKSLFNMNPLIKLDGYYLLSDLLGIPNLRQRAVGFLGNKVRRLLGMDLRPAERATARERRIFFWYGLLAWTYSTGFLALIGWHFFGFATDHFQGWGFAVFTFLLTQVLHTPLKRCFAGTGQGGETRTWNMKKWLKRGLRLAVLIGAVAAAYFIQTDLRISGPFHVLPVHNCDVRAEVEGIIQHIYVDEGQTIRKGDLIAQLSDRDLRAELTKTTAQIAETDARLKLLLAGPRPEEVELARTILKKSQELLDYASIHLRMDEDLRKANLLSERELETTRERVALRRKEIQEAQDKLKLLQAGSRQEEIDATAAELNRLNAHRGYVQEQLELLKVHTPVDGTVTSYRIRDKIGQAVKKGDLIAEVHEMRKVTVEIDVPEKEIADISVGQKVILKARAYPLENFEALVTAVAPVATEHEAQARTDRTVRVRTELDNANLLLKPEMSGQAKIYCGERRLLQIIGRRFVRFFKVDFWSWW